MAIFHYNLSNQRYDTSRNNKVQSINNINMSGVLTRFWYGHKKVENKLWFNLHALLKNIVNLSVPKCVVFGIYIYGSKISDLTN